MDVAELRSTLSVCEIPQLFGKDRLWRWGEDADALWLQLVFYAPARQACRKWRISRHATRSEVVGTAFLACKQAMEHELREQFRYRERAIYSPHYDVDRLKDFHGDTEFDQRVSRSAEAVS